MTQSVSVCVLIVPYAGWGSSQLPSAPLSLPTLKCTDYISVGLSTYYCFVVMFRLETAAGWGCAKAPGQLLINLSLPND